MSRLLVAVLILFALVSSARAEDAQAIHRWFLERFMQVDVGSWIKGTSCCSEADGKMRPVQILADGMFATQRDDGAWLFFAQDIIEPDEKCENPFFQWVTWIVGDRVVCACRPRIGG